MNAKAQHIDGDVHELEMWEFCWKPQYEAGTHGHIWSHFRFPHYYIIYYALFIMHYVLYYIILYYIIYYTSINTRKFTQLI